MSKNKEELTGHEPDYIRGLRNARAHLPKIIDRETGTERDVFAPVPKDEVKKAAPIDANEFLRQHLLKQKAAKEAAEEAAVIVPDWLYAAIKESKLGTLDLGKTDNIAKIMTIAAQQEKLAGIAIVADPKTGETVVFTTTNEEPTLNEQDHRLVGATIATLFAKLFQKHELVEEKETPKSPAKQEKKASTKATTKTTKKSTGTKKKASTKKSAK